MEYPLSGLFGGSDFEKQKHLTVVFACGFEHLNSFANGLRHIDEFEFRCRSFGCLGRLFPYYGVEPVAELSAGVV